MKSAIALIASVFLPAVSFASVENIISMQRDANGTFSVVCDTKGVITNNLGQTADSIRGDTVCSGEVHIALLQEGLYKTSADFCSQNVKWVGEDLHLALESPCSGTVKLTKFQDGWYRGKLEGYEYTYEVEVKGETTYVFYSRSFGTQGEFSKSTSETVPFVNKAKKHHNDPARL